MQDARVLFIFALFLLALFSYEWSQLSVKEAVNKPPQRELVKNKSRQPSQKQNSLTTSPVLPANGKLRERVARLESVVAGLREDLINEREENNLLREWVTSQMFTMQSQEAPKKDFHLSTPSTDDSSGVVVGVDMNTNRPVTLPPYRLRMLWSKPKEGIVNAAFKEQVRVAMDELRVERQMERRQRRLKRDINWYTKKLSLDGAQQEQLQGVLAQSRDKLQKAIKFYERGKMNKWKKSIRSHRQEKNDAIMGILNSDQQLLFQQLLDAKKDKK